MSTRVRVERRGNRVYAYEMYNSNDKIGRAFRDGNLYELPLMSWVVDQNYRGGILDVGANIGNHSLFWAEVGGYDVIAYEPVIPHVVAANAELNGSNIDVRPYGLSDVAGEYHHIGKGVLRPGKSKESTDEVVHLKRLNDEKIYFDVSFIKIDVEGHEVNVLRGGMDIIREYAPDIAVEEWEGATTRGVLELLGPMGYRKIQSFGGRGRAPMSIYRVVI